MSAPDAALVDQLVAVTGVERSLAVGLLEACGGNLEMAINMQMEDQGQGGGGGPGTSGQGAGGEEEVRAPIPQKQEQMVQPGFEGYVMNNRVGKAGNGGRRVRSVFDGFRDFQAETKRMEAALDTDTDRQEERLGVSRAKKRTLEELFKPPLDLMWSGDWSSAREQATNSGRWLLVNIQDAKEFQCQVLNRDLWANPGVKAIIGEHFVFWQQYRESDEAERYMTFYSIDKWPYVAIIDPRTGENMVTWANIDAAAFPALITEFLTLHPSLESPVKEPVRKKIKTDNPVEMDEAAQLEAAIAASLAETMERHESESGSDLETFSDEESNQGTPRTTQSGKSGSEQNDANTNFNNSNGSISDKACELNPSSQSNGLDTSEEASWEKYLGVLDEESPSSITNILIRFPDGSRESWRQSAESLLKSLLLFVEFKGFSLVNHEVVTNFPRVVVSELDRNKTLKEVELCPRQTVFVQIRDQ